MGLSVGTRSCSTNYTTVAPAPNPNPKRWELLGHWQFASAYVLKVKYLDATNYEGIKLMVFRGRFPGARNMTELDPHFRPGAASPIARFRPDAEGYELAGLVAQSVE